MGSAVLLDLWRDALLNTIWVGGPFVLAALAVGLLASLFQAATQLQENILSFAPKVVAVGVTMSVTGVWILRQLVAYLNEVGAVMVQIGGGAQ